MKKISDSAIETRYLVLAKDINAHGTVFGGTILSWIDMTASMAAEKYAAAQVVTAAIDSVSFHTPINLDDHVILNAHVNYVHNTSMEVFVQVIKENPHTGTKTLATEAFVTMVALDKNKKPTPVPDLILENEKQKKNFQQGHQRRLQRLKNRSNNS